MGKSIRQVGAVQILTLGFLLGLPHVTTAATVTVDCSSPKAKIKTIAAGLAQLSTSGPNSLLVSGTCIENVVIEGYRNLTVQGNPAATIDGSGSPADYALVISGFGSVSVNNFTIDGGAGTTCAAQSNCRFNTVVFQNSNDAGVFFNAGTTGVINLSTIQNNPYSDGLIADLGANVVVAGTTIQGNGTDPACGTECGGIYVGPGSMVSTGRSGTTPTVIQNNTAAYGIRAVLNSTLRVGRNTAILGNGTNGIELIQGATAHLQALVSITGNGARGIILGDQTLVSIGGPGVVISGNSGGTDQVWCWGQFAATRGVVGNFPTNCAAEPPYVP